MHHLGTNRRTLFEAIECGALLNMPAEPYTYAEWRRCLAEPPKVPRAQHVE